MSNKEIENMCVCGHSEFAHYAYYCDGFMCKCTELKAKPKGKEIDTGCKQPCNLHTACPQLDYEVLDAISEINYGVVGHREGIDCICDKCCAAAQKLVDIAFPPQPKETDELEQIQSIVSVALNEVAPDDDGGSQYESQEEQAEAHEEAFETACKQLQSLIQEYTRREVVKELGSYQQWFQRLYDSQTAYNIGTAAKILENRVQELSK